MLKAAKASGARPQMRQKPRHIVGDPKNAATGQADSHPQREEDAVNAAAGQAKKSDPPGHRVEKDAKDVESSGPPATSHHASAIAVALGSAHAVVE